MQLAVSRPHCGTVRCVAADAELLASGSSDHQIRVWRLASQCGGGDESNSNGGSSSVRNSAAASPSSSSNSTTASGVGGVGGSTTTAGLLDRRVVLAGGHTGPVTALALTPEALFSGSWDYSVRVWDRAALECTAALRLEDWVSSLEVGLGWFGWGEHD